MRKGKFPPQATFYRGHFAPTWCFVIVPFLSSEFVFLLSFGEKSPTFPPQWKFEQLVKHELSPDSFSTRGTRKSYLIKIEFSTLIPSPLSSKKKNSRHAPRLAKIYRNYPIYFFSGHVERNETRKILSFQELLNSRIRKLGECQCQIYHWIKLYIYIWRREGRRIYHWKRIGASILCSNFARTESGSVCTLPSPPPSPQPNFSGLPALITSIPYRIACHWQNG